ncbi:MAG: DNA polymerase/3'-5' exonuclease PolX [Candidatus Omnitrophica bacterium]|nr:DNA polymerase/3'-5' exonuclease PolX [Candidatus Omnitrophota bacterium]
MNSQEIAVIFREIAEILELKGENPFRIRAYLRAAERVEQLGSELEVIADKGQLTEIPGIGVDLASKIRELLSTGSLTYYQQLKKEIPEGLLKMLNIQGLGPKTVKRLYQEFNIDSIEKLEKYARSGKLGQIEGIKEKTQKNILRGIELLKEGSSRLLLPQAIKIAEDFLSQLKKLKEVEKIEVGGSLRRQKETVRDIDILVASSKPLTVIEKFTRLAPVKEILSHGETKASVIAGGDNVQVDLRVVDKKSFGSSLLYFTGSKSFNIALRGYVQKKGYKINEYGVFSVNVGAHSRAPKPLAGKTEEGIFSLLKMSYIPPELREDRGEIEAALKDNLPKLVETKEMKGDFHVHSLYSDGKNTIQEMAEAAQKRGYKYLGISDHSQSLKVAGGLSIKELKDSIEEIEKINRKLKGIKVLAGTEVDILAEGGIDYPESILKELDFVIAAIHSGFKQPKAKQTKRIISACKNKYVNFIAHPTGGLWGVRDPYQIDLEEVLKAASDYGVALEINCHPERYDLNDISAMQAKQRGVKLALNTDSHSVEQLQLIDLGISVARRAWLTSSDIVNCMSLGELEKWLKK